MKVKEIIKNALTYINEPEMYQTIITTSENLLPSDVKLVLNTLISCINLTNNLIASEYYPLKDSVNINSKGLIAYSSINKTNAINEILKVEKNGVEVKFKTLLNGVETENGNVVINYSYLPKDISVLEDDINDYPIKITSRIFSYGVVSEYYFINGMYDDATIWDTRFKNSLQNILRPKREVKIKGRLWA